MSTHIEWTDETWNPSVGCTPVSAGCKNCYAAKEAVRLAGNPNRKVRALYAGTSEMRGTGKNRRAVFTGLVNQAPDRLDAPFHWRAPRRVFVNSMSDLFHEDLPDEFIDAVFAVMAGCLAIGRGHTFQILTKRPERMLAYMADTGRAGAVAAETGKGVDGDRHWPFIRPDDMPWPLPNVWLGTSVEDQEQADARIPLLLQTPAAVRFISAEPLLGPINLRRLIGSEVEEYDYLDALTGWREAIAIGAENLPALGPTWPGLNWVIGGGESGSSPRPCDILWLRAIKDQCAATGVAYFLKQLGANPTVGGDAGVNLGLLKFLDRLKNKKGGDINEFPEDLRVRQFPKVPA